MKLGFKCYKHTIAFLAITLFSCSFSFAQKVVKTEMEKLSFMVGDWVGTSTVITKDTISKQGPAFEKIEYKLDKKIITLDLNSAFLQLHTVIYYDVEEQKYYYSPYSKSGNGKYLGEFTDNKFIVWFSTTRRLIFKLTPTGDFQEYGENLIDGKWHKYFEDTLTKSP